MNKQHSFHVRYGEGGSIHTKVTSTLTIHVAWCWEKFACPSKVETINTCESQG